MHPFYNQNLGGQLSFGNLDVLESIAAYYDENPTDLNSLNENFHLHQSNLSPVPYI